MRHSILDNFLHNDGTHIISAAAILEELDKQGDENVCLGCSGGSDSVFLLCYICEKFPNIKKKLTILHYNHNLRGADSDGDEQFVKQLAEQNDLPFFCEKLQGKLEKVSEDILRCYRNDFFEKMLGKTHSRVLLLGHQKNDVVETLIMRLLRGSGTSGLSAPREVTAFGTRYIKVRPLLKFSKSEIEQSLTARHIPWRIDKSNLGTDYFRNKIRNVIIPSLEKISGKFHIIDTLSAAKDNITEAELAVQYFAKIAERQLWNGKHEYNAITVDKIRDLPIAVVKKILTTFLAKNNITIQKSNIESLIQLIYGTGKNCCALSDGKQAEIKDNTVTICSPTNIPTWATIHWSSGKIAMPDGRILTKKIVQIPHHVNITDRRSKCYMDARYAGDIYVKQYRAHYRYIPFGHHTARKLGDISIKSSDKNALPVVCVGEDACWVPGISICNKFKLLPTTKEALLLTYS